MIRINSWCNYLKKECYVSMGFCSSSYFIFKFSSFSITEWYNIMCLHFEVFNKSKHEQPSSSHKHLVLRESVVGRVIGASPTFFLGVCELPGALCTCECDRTGRVGISVFLVQHVQKGGGVFKASMYNRMDMSGRGRVLNFFFSSS